MKSARRFDPTSVMIKLNSEDNNYASNKYKTKEKMDVKYVIVKRVLRTIKCVQEQHN